MRITQAQRAILEDHERWSMRGLELAADIEVDHPWLAVVVGQDMASAERSTELVAAGMRPLTALPFVGSYSRMGWALDNLTERQLLQRICDLWRGADPDDTDPRFRDMWHRLWMLRGRTPFLDGEPLPEGERLTIYRGQKAGDALGIAWSLSEDIATKFAMGAAERRADMNGIVIYNDVPREEIVAYITGRGEQEVIWLG